MALYGPIDQDPLYRPGPRNYASRYPITRTQELRLQVPYY